MASVEQVAALIAYVGGRPSADDAFAGRKYDEAHAILTGYLDAEAHRVPAAVFNEQVLEVASKLWARKGAPNGQANYGTLDGTPMPAPRDPMVTTYPVLAPFLSGGFA